MMGCNSGLLAEKEVLEKKNSFLDSLVKIGGKGFRRFLIVLEVLLEMHLELMLLNLRIREARWGDILKVLMLILEKLSLL
ncbi:hypothetical protein [Borrelia persica]|uniref:hypothetical protein n=1 Tax=Borrelia persica TaxID=44448 RepID=UPI0004B866CC